MGAITKFGATQTKTHEELMSAFQSGNRDSLGLLFEQLQAPLVSFAASRVPSKRSGKQQLAQDAVQNAFTKVISNAGGKSSWKPGRAKVMGWMKMIVAQQVIELTRKKSGSEQVCTDFDTSERRCYSVEQLKDLPNRFTQDFEAILQEVFRLLPPELGEVVTLILQGRTSKEIANGLGISVPTVCRRRHQALRMISDIDFGLAA